MARRSRCIIAGLPCHITQRGVDRCTTFSSNLDRATYLHLLRQNLPDAQVRVLGWCLMSNHVHLVAVPEREDSLSILLRRVHGRYAQYYNARADRTGHLWQNRFFACVLGEEHLWRALAYVDQNPVRAGIVADAAEYPWSSAAAHVTGVDPSGLLDNQWWRQQTRSQNWKQELTVDNPDAVAQLRRCTYSGRPFASDDLLQQIAERFGRSWTRGRPKTAPVPAASGAESANPFGLF